MRHPPEAANRGSDLVQTHLNAKPALYTAGPTGYKRMLQRDDLEAIFLTAPAVLHGPMAIESLRANKWVFSEVPACHSIEEGWQLVRAAEESRAGYFLAENYCFSRNNLMILRMAEEGMFGTPTFGETGYIHNTRDLQFNSDGSLTWRGEENGDPTIIGNTYPTHSLGPISQALGITRGDLFTSCVSMMTPPQGFHLYAAKRFGADSAPGKIDTWNGDNTLTLIRTESGAVVYLRFDNASPRPHRIGFYTLQGTKASVDDERGVYLDWQSKGWEPFDKYYSQYDHPYWLRNSEKAKDSGHSGGDFLPCNTFTVASAKTGRRVSSFTTPSLGASLLRSQPLPSGKVRLRSRCRITPVVSGKRASVLIGHCTVELPVCPQVRCSRGIAE